MGAVRAAVLAVAAAVSAVAFDVTRYYTLEEQAAHLDALHNRFPNWAAKPVAIGKSVEGRDIWAQCISLSGCTAAPSGGLLLTGLHHAREPVGMVTALSYATTLLELLAAGDASATALMARTQLHVIPCVNPDAYAFNLAHTAQHQVMARKNRRGGCTTVGANGEGQGYEMVGVDLNRNYDFAWSHDDVGSSRAPCAEDYRGPAPLSEPESAAVAAYVAAHAAGITVALNYHSFGRFINLPYAVQSLGAPPPDAYDTYLALARRMAARTGFGYGHPWAGGLYSVNGEASDWMLDAHGVYAMSPELGPAMDAPFEAGMWPATADLPTLVAQGRALADSIADLAAARFTIAATAADGGAAGSGGDIAPTAREPVALGGRPLHCGPVGGSDPSGASGQCTLPPVTITNNGVRPARGAVVVSFAAGDARFTHPALCSIPGTVPTVAATGATNASGAPCTVSLPALLGVPEPLSLPATAPTTNGAGGMQCASSALLTSFGGTGDHSDQINGASGMRALESVDFGSTASARMAGVAAVEAHPPFSMDATRALISSLREDYWQPHHDVSAAATDTGSAWHADRTDVQGAYEKLLAQQVAAAAPRSLQASAVAAVTTSVAGATVLYVRSEAASGPSSSQQGGSTASISGLLPRHTLSLPAVAIQSAAAAQCGAAGAGAAAPLVVAVSDDDHCGVFAVSCDGNAQLLFEGSTTCMPCALFRSHDWPRALGFDDGAAAAPSPAAGVAPAPNTTQPVDEESPVQWPFDHPARTAPALQVFVIVASALATVGALVFARRWRSRSGLVSAARGYGRVPTDVDVAEDNEGGDAASSDAARSGRVTGDRRAAAVRPTALAAPARPPAAAESLPESP